MAAAREPWNANIVPADESRLDALARLGCKLWPDNEKEAMREDFRELLESDRDAVYVADREGQTIGFVHVSIRTDPVEGATSSPVGYVEGIYVDETFRCGGIGRALIRTAEEWAKARGCTQLGSDTWLDNVQSQLFHLKSGFREAGRIVAFIKEIE
jgi:aminoglycoside 6'-N-acetyltransferase I